MGSHHSENIPSLLEVEALDTQIYQDRSPQWRDILLPAYLHLLDQIEVEVPENDATYKTITFEQLEEAFYENPLSVQELKIDHLAQLVSIRYARGLGTAFKASMQYLLQRDGLGDPSTFITDPVDLTSSRAIGKFLLETMGRKNLWIGFAKTGDFTDPNSVHKNEQPPLLGHDPDPYNGRTDSINSLEDLDYYLGIARRIVKDERIHKIAVKLARGRNPGFDNMLIAEQNKLIEDVTHESTILIDQVYDHKIKWRDLNNILEGLGQTPLEKYDHSLIKIFAQDIAEGKMGQALLDKNSLTLEFSPDQFTPRNHEKSDAKIRITLAVAPSGRIIIGCEKSQLPYLYPLLNSKDFFAHLDETLVHRIKSPYYDVQILLKLGRPVADIENNNFKEVMEQGEVAFVADVIAGIHKSNTRDRNGDHPHFLPFLESLNVANAESYRLDESTFKLILDGTSFNTLYTLILKSVTQPNKLNEVDRFRAKLLLEQKSTLELCYRLPPSTFINLKEIAEFGQPRRVPYRVLLLLEQQITQ